MSDIVSAGVDWLTLSSPAGGIEHFLEIMAERVGELAQQGHDTKSVSWPGGYEGWGIGPVSWLTKGQAQLAVLSGATAGEFASRIMRRAPPDARITRIDLQVTVADANVIGDDMIVAAKACPRVRQTGEIVNSLGGHTVYIGSRKSSQFGRFYAKYSTALETWPDYTWRWEVEFKKPAAGRVWDRLQDSANIPDLVRGWYLDRDLPVDWAAGEAVPLDGLSAREPTDLERKLEWIRRQVRPFCLDCHEQDRLYAFLEALGLATIPAVASEVVRLLGGQGS